MTPLLLTNRTIITGDVERDAQSAALGVRHDRDVSDGGARHTSRVASILRIHKNISVRLALLPIAVSAALGCQAASVTSGPTSAKCQLTLVAPGNIAPDGGTATITVTAPPECGWDVSTQASWISNLTPTSGQGTGTVEFLATANPVPSARQGEIVINQDKIPVSQDPAPCLFSITPTDLTVVATGGPGTVNVTTLTGCSWTAASDVPWITVTAGASGSGNGAVRFSSASNVGTTPRIGNVTIAGQPVTITQSAPTLAPAPAPGTGSAPSPTPTPSPVPPPCIYAITPNTFTVGASGGVGPTVSVAAASGCMWGAVSNDSWITVTTGAIGNGNGTVTFTVAANPTNARTGTITIAGQTLTVTQGTNCTFLLNRSNVTVPLAGASRAVIVTASGPLCSWTSSTTASWITFTSSTTVTGSGTVTFDIASTGAARSTTLVIAGQSVSVTQQ
jgi:hypothetical protein